MRCYPVLTLAATSPEQSFEEPLTLAEVRTSLKIPERSPEDAGEEAQLERMIKSAREQAEALQNRELVQKQLAVYYDYFPCEIPLHTPLVSVDSIEYTDSDNQTFTVDPSGYFVDTVRGLVMPAYGESWPSFTGRPSSAVVVRYTAGFSASDAFWNDAGARIKEGMCKLISHWYYSNLPFEVAPGSQQAVEMPFTVTALLSMGAVPRVH